MTSNMSSLSILIFTLFFSQMRGESPSKWEKPERDNPRWELQEVNRMELQGREELQAFVKSSASRTGIKPEDEKAVNSPYPKEKTIFLDVDSVRRIIKCTNINTNKEKLEKLGKEIFNFLSLIFDYATRIIIDINDCSVLKIFQCAKHFSYEITYGFYQFIKSCEKLIQNLNTDGIDLVNDVSTCLNNKF